MSTTKIGIPPHVQHSIRSTDDTPSRRPCDVVSDGRQCLAKAVNIRVGLECLGSQYVTATWLNVDTGENVVICPQDLYKID